MDILKQRTALAVFAMLAAAALPGSALAQDVDFSGERIELIIGSAPGGSSDIVARFLAQKLEEQLPGKPTILVRNITSGGGTIGGANYFEKHAKPDGKWLFYGGSGAILAPLFMEEEEGNQLAYDPAKWVTFMAMPGGVMTVGSKVGGVTGLPELKALIDLQTPVPMGASAPTGISMAYVAAHEVLGTKINPAFNTGSAATTQAFLRGEFKIQSTTMTNYKATLKPLEESGEVVPLYSLGFTNSAGALVRDPGAPDTPHLGEAYEIMFGKKPEGQAYENYVTLIDVLVTSARSIVLPADTPENVIQTYVHAMERAMKDYEADPRAAEILGPTPPIIGDDARKRLVSMYAKLTNGGLARLDPRHLQDQVRRSDLIQEQFSILSCRPIGRQLLFGGWLSREWRR